MRSDNLKVRTSALTAVGKIDDEKATETLVGALGDSSEEVRDYALKTLFIEGKKLLNLLLGG